MKKAILFILSFVMVSTITKAQFGNSIYLDGTQDYYEIQESSYLDLNGSFTIDVWIMPIKVVDIVNILNKGMCTSDNYGYNLAIIDGKINWMWKSTGSCNSNESRLESVDAVIHENDCSHIVVVHTNTYAKIYLNGIEVACQYILGGTNFNIYNSSANARIGTYKTISSFENYYWGTIDELRIWDYAFSDSEVQSYVQAPLIGNESGLVAYYDMEDTSPNTLTNKAIISGSALDAQEMGSSSFMTSCIIYTDNLKLSKNKIEIYPNPFKNQIIINNFTEGEIIIYDLLGNVVYNKFVKRSSNVFIDLSSFKSGIYFVKLSSNIKHKLIKL